MGKRTRSASKRATRPTYEQLEAANADEVAQQTNERLKAEVKAEHDAVAEDDGAGVDEITAEAKRKRMAATKDWRWLLWDSAFATEYLHQKLGAGWAAVLKEACCVRKDAEKDKVNRLREEGDSGPLRLWPKRKYGVRHDFKDMVVTVPLLEWCVRRKYKPDVMTFQAVARGGNMDAIRWLREHKCPWYEEYGPNARINACRGAAEGGHLNVLTWLRNEGCPWNEWTCEGAAEGGYLDVLKYAHENGCPWDERTCRKAAEGGHLDMLKYAHENGCPWGAMTCASAAIEGRLDVLKYAHENGCPWDKLTCWIAAARGHFDVLKYARANGCPWSKRDCRHRASDNGHAHVVAWIDAQPA